MHDSGDYLLTPEVCMEHTVNAMIVCVFCMLMGPRPAFFAPTGLMKVIVIFLSLAVEVTVLNREKLHI